MDNFQKCRSYLSATLTDTFVRSTNMLPRLVATVYLNIIRQLAGNQLQPNHFVGPVGAKNASVQLRLFCNNFKHCTRVFGKLFPILSPTSATRTEIMEYKINQAVRENLIFSSCFRTTLRYHRPKSHLWSPRRNTNLI